MTSTELHIANISDARRTAGSAGDINVGYNERLAGAVGGPLLTRFYKPAAFYEAPRVGQRQRRAALALGRAWPGRCQGRMGGRDHRGSAERADRLALA